MLPKKTMTNKSQFDLQGFKVGDKVEWKASGPAAKIFGYQGQIIPGRIQAFLTESIKGKTKTWAFVKWHKAVARKYECDTHTISVVLLSKLKPDRKKRERHAVHKTTSTKSRRKRDSS